MAATTVASAADPAIRPFRVEIPKADLDDLRAGYRLTNTGVSASRPRLL